MEFRQLEAFVVVTELKSFSKAAEYLCLSQSTVSSHIKNLETELQKKLMHRTTKSLQLTPEGDTFLRYAKRILETKEAAIDAINSSTESVLHLGASTIPSGYLLPDLLNRFRRIHPATYFNVKQGDSREIQERILDGTVELGLIGEPNPSSKCTNIPFCTDELVLVTPATRHYLALRKHNPDLLSLLKEPIIIREQGSGTQKAADRLLNELAIDYRQLNVAAQINDLESIKQMVIGGMGISILSRFAIADLERRGQVIVYPMNSTIKRKFFISYLESRKMPPALQEFIDFVFRYYNASAPV
ncbi:MAG: selenium metabolism-associated LysR family transcriptional regulator [Lachnospiraceae bacterium]